MAFDNIFEIMKERGLTAYRVSKDTGISQASKKRPNMLKCYGLALMLDFYFLLRKIYQRKI